MSVHVCQYDIFVEPHLGKRNSFVLIFRNTKTYIWDVSDLNNIELVNVYESQLTVIDHNMYIKGDLCFQSNYMVSNLYNSEDPGSKGILGQVMKILITIIAT